MSWWCGRGERALPLCRLRDLWSRSALESHRRCLAALCIRGIIVAGAGSGPWLDHHQANVRKASVLRFPDHDENKASASWQAKKTSRTLGPCHRHRHFFLANGCSRPAHPEPCAMVSTGHCRRSLESEAAGSTREFRSGAARNRTDLRPHDRLPCCSVPSKLAKGPADHQYYWHSSELAFQMVESDIPLDILPVLRTGIRNPGWERSHKRMAHESWANFVDPAVDNAGSPSPLLGERPGRPRANITSSWRVQEPQPSRCYIILDHVP
jgi:hypothetical protein